MLRLRLTHIDFGSKTIHHVWVGQQWDAWEDQTNEYPTAQQAELALLRKLVGVEMEPTFDYLET
jgi:hypothetical protein